MTTSKKRIEEEDPRNFTVALYIPGGMFLGNLVDGKYHEPAATKTTTTDGDTREPMYGQKKVDMKESLD